MRVSLPNCISIGSAVFTRLTNVTISQTDTQTDHATPFVAKRLRRSLMNVKEQN